MPEDAERIRIRCSNCDYLLGTVPPDFRFGEDSLICPNCGAEIEVPEGEPVGRSVPPKPKSR